MPWRPRMTPPVGKSGPNTIPLRSSMLSAGLAIIATQASITSPRLCGGMLVAIPTAIPPAPFTDDVANHAGRFYVFLVRRVPLLVHRIEDAPMHRLEPVARIGKRARHDHAHGVIEIASLHLLRDGHGTDIGGVSGKLVVCICQ